jgi:hypothetical protein
VKGSVWVEPILDEECLSKVDSRSIFHYKQKKKNRSIQKIGEGDLDQIGSWTGGYNNASLLREALEMWMRRGQPILMRLMRR